jgi:hypothetical protein
LIDSDDLLSAIVGQRKVATFKEVKFTSMRLARIVREVIASDLGGKMPTKGKQFLTTKQGIFRLASRPNSDNTTEQLAHKRMGATVVQVFGELSPTHIARGWISVEQLYARHGKRFNATQMLQKVARRFVAAP